MKNAKDTKRKVVTLTLTVDKERVRSKTLFKLALSAMAIQLVIFNIGLCAAALGAEMVFGYALLSSFTRWAGLNLLGIGARWIYGTIFKMSAKPTLSKDVRTRISKFDEEVRNAAVDNSVRDIEEKMKKAGLIAKEEEEQK